MMSCSEIFAQKKIETRHFLDSTLIDIQKVYFNPKQIESINVVKNESVEKIFIKTKQGSSNYLTLNDVLKKYTTLDLSMNSILFRINGKVIDDITGIKIDDSFFIYVDTASLAKNQYLDDKFKPLYIVDIALEKEERKIPIILRGDDTSAPKFQKS
jgi:hypothetical protein